MKNLSKYIAATLLIMASVSNLYAQNDIASKIDEYVQETYVGNLPGASFLVVKDGEVLYRSAKGMANVELGIPLQADMVFRLGSLTKQFTAASILMLEERELLNVEDTIDKFLPDYPYEIASKITVEHLLTHTSGIYSYTNIPGYMISNEIRAELTTDQLVEVFADLDSPSDPGEAFAYNNSGYVLLGAIIEKVSGKSYEAFVQENIFDKLGMENSYYGGHQKIIPRRVDGYQFVGDDFSNALFLSMTQPHAAGSLLSNVDDLAKWDQALFSGQVISDASFRKMTTAGVLNNGQRHSYGYGLFIGEFNETPMIYHSGGIHGFATYASHVVDENLYVVSLSNGATRERNPGNTVQKIISLVLE